MKSDKNISAEELQRRKRKYTNMLVILFLMIAASLFSLFYAEQFVDFEWNQESVQVTDPDGNRFTIVYDAVTGLELTEHPDYGYCHSGGKRSGWIYGSWENDAWGRYTLCASSNTGLCIVLHAGGETFVLSYESDDVTAALFDSIHDLIP